MILYAITNTNEVSGIKQYRYFDVDPMGCITRFLIGKALCVTWPEAKRRGLSVVRLSIKELKESKKHQRANRIGAQR